MILPPRRATFRRWLKLSGTRYSIYRGLEYEALCGLHFEGRVLDVGGGAHNSYYNLFKIDGAIDSINIDPHIRPTILADLNRPWPMSNNQYDHVISLNTLEHIHHDQHAIQEVFRVLRPGGTFHIGVPFLYRVHGSPSDFHRHTSYWWLSFLNELPKPPQDLVIEPLVWDPYSSGFSLVEFMRFRAIRKRIIMLRAVLSHLRWRGERLPDDAGHLCAEYTLGYYLHGTR
jgi:SAM-dependent methyltransferase